MRRKRKIKKYTREGNPCTLLPTDFQLRRKVKFKFISVLFFFHALKMNFEVPFPKAVFLISMRTGIRLSFFAPLLEKKEIGIYLMLFVFCFPIALKKGFEFLFSYGIWKKKLKLDFCFSFSARASKLTIFVLAGILN